MRALIYTRVSSDKSKVGRSVTEQEQECRAHCERQGWTVAKVLTENDRSASRHAKKARPIWEQVKAEIGDGEFDVLVTWEASRAQRDLDAYAELRRLCAGGGVKWCYGGSTYDMADRTDRFRTGLDALVAEDEADRARERVMRALRANARQGRPHGRAPYGYVRVYDPVTGAARQVIDPAAADVIREAARRILSGESARSIALDFEARQIPTQRGGTWRLNTLSQMLTNPALVAKRTHLGHRNIIGDGDWPALLDDITFARLQAVFADTTRHRNRNRGNVHVLSAALRCGICGAGMSIGRTRGSDTPFVYRCVSTPHLTRNKDQLDRYVTELVLERLTRPDATQLFAQQIDDTETAVVLAEIIDLNAKLDDALTAFKAGDLSAAMLGRVEAEIVPLVAARERQARRSDIIPPVAFDLVHSDDPRQHWAALSDEQRRAAIGALVTVTVHPVKKRGGTFDPTDLTVEWRRW